jgi:hypothetical protein
VGDGRCYLTRLMRSIVSTLLSCAAFVAVFALSTQLAAHAAPAKKASKEKWVKHDFHNMRGVCLTSAKLYAIPSAYIKLRRGRYPTKMKPGSPLYVMFEGTCENRCQRRGKASCTVERKDHDIIVSLDGSYEAQPYEETGCYARDSVCTPKVCALPKLEAGAYTLRYGENWLDFSVPGELPQHDNCLSGPEAFDHSRPVPE